MLRERCVSAKGFMGVHKGRDHTAQFEWYRELMLIQPVSKKHFGAGFCLPRKREWSLECGEWSFKHDFQSDFINHNERKAYTKYNSTFHSPHSTLIIL